MRLADCSKNGRPHLSLLLLAVVVVGFAVPVGANERAEKIDELILRYLELEHMEWKIPNTPDTKFHATRRDADP